MFLTLNITYQQLSKLTPFMASNWYRQYTLVQNVRSVDSGKIVYLSLQNPAGLKQGYCNLSRKINSC